MDVPSAEATEKAPPGRVRPGPRDYYGCRPVSIPAEEYEDYEGRVECWEASTETAMVLREPSFVHEYSARRMGELIHQIAMARGSAIVLGGSTDLVQRDGKGGRELLLQADETIYLHPRRDRPKGLYIEVGSDAMPDVLLEVDYTTDVRRGRRGRRGKLDDYAAWGLPEIWVEVPDSSLFGPRRAGLTIFLLEGDRYVESASSRAFPGLEAAVVHRALNEEEQSEETVAALRYVGRAMGSAEGTGPDDNLFLRREREESRRRGLVRGEAKGRAEGRAETVRMAIREAFAARGLRMSAALEEWLDHLEAPAEPAAVMRIAFECRNAADFLRRAEHIETA